MATCVCAAKLDAKHHRTAHLGLHLPTRDGRLAIVARFELQGDGAWADVGDGHVGGRTRKLWEDTERRDPEFHQETERETTRSVTRAWNNLPQHPLVAAQILHTDKHLSDATYFPLSPVHPTSEGSKSRLVWEKMLTHSTQAETMT